MPLHSPFCALAAVASFLAAAAIVRAPLTWPGGEGVQDKWDYFRHHVDEYDVVLFGSSRVYRSFAPREMEQEWKQHGHDLRAFNLAAPGAGRFETDSMLAEVLALEPRRLALAIVELAPWDPDDLRGNEFSRRSVHWHTLAATRSALESCFSYPNLERGDRVRLAARHLALGARRLSSYGRGAELLGTFVREPDPVLSSEAQRHGGYRPLEAEPFSGVRGRHAAFLADPDRGPEPKSDGRPSELNSAALERRVRSSRAAGVEILFVVPPGHWSPPEELGLDLEPLPAVLAYSDRGRYPKLYAREALFDSDHLNEDAARNLSRVFARDLLPHLP